MSRFVRVASAAGPVFAERDGSTLWALDKAPWLGGQRNGEAVVGDRLVPIVPSKILCVGRNYRAHAEELGNAVPKEPLIFFKPPSALLLSGSQLCLPNSELSQRVEHEVELGVVVGSRLRNVSEDQAQAGIFGYLVVADITARDLQRASKLWTLAKGMDGFFPVADEVVTDVDVSAAQIRCWVDGELRQDSNTSRMVFSPAAVIAYLSRYMTLLPGDVIATGTPAGVGPLVDGNAMRMEIAGVGCLTTVVRG